MWIAIGQIGLVLAAAVVGGSLAWRWRGRRAWRREQALKREWSETLASSEALMSRRMDEAREATAVELAAREAEVETLRQERDDLAEQLGARRSVAAPPRPQAPTATQKPRRPTRKRRQPAPNGDGVPLPAKGAAPSDNGAAGSEDLKQIRGVGRVYERRLHEMGYTTIRDIAGWGPEEIERVTRGLDTSPGRIEGWIRQAKELASRTVT